MIRPGSNFTRTPWAAKSLSAFQNPYNPVNPNSYYAGTGVAPPSTAPCQTTCNNCCDEGVQISFDDSLKDLWSMQKLYDQIFTQLDTYLTQFKDGSFECLDNIMTDDDFAQLGMLINDPGEFEDYNPDEALCYLRDKLMVSKYRTHGNKIIDGLKKAKLQCATLNEKCAQVEHLTEFKDILHDKEKLTEFVEDHYNNPALFDVAVQTKVAATIKEDYALYIERYGMPEGLVFCTEKLSEIRKELGMTFDE